MKVFPLQDFSWAYGGVNVVEHKAGESFETEDEDLIRVAVTEEGWAAEDDGKQKVKAPKTARNAAKPEGAE